MLLKRPNSLKSLILTYEIAFIFLVAVTGILGVAAAYFWQVHSSESIRINRQHYTIEQVRGELYAQIQEVIRARVLEQTQAVELYADYSRRIDRHFNELRQRSSMKIEDMAIQNLHGSYREIQKDMNSIFSDPYLERQVTRLKILDPQFAQRMVGNFENNFISYKKLLAKDRQVLDKELELRKKLAPFIIAIPLLIAIALVFYTRRIMKRGFVTPMQNIINGAGEMSQGNLEHIIAEQGVEEVSELAATINSMSKELSDSRDQLVATERQAALGALVPVVAHNIRNPLASIRATAQLIDDAEDKEELVEYRSAIIETIDRLGRWVSSLVSYLHPLKPNYQKVKASALLDAAASLLMTKLEQKKMKLDKQDWSNDMTLKVDPDLMEQALYSLMNNAVDASSKGDDLILKLSRDNEMLAIHIIDQGGGIPFTPNADNLEPGPSTKKFGTGLGIPIAFKICKEHGWELSFNHYEHNNKKGTEVVLLAPIKEISGENN